MAPLTICMAGDTMLGRIVDKGLTYASQHKTQVWGDLLPFFSEKRQEASREGGGFLLAANLECAITTEDAVENPKTFNFRLLQQNADVLSVPGFDFVSLANNHTLDYHQQGLQDTVQALDKLGVSYAGAGLLSEAKRAAVLHSKSSEGNHSQAPPPVAFVSMSDHYKQWAATDMIPGINYVNPEAFDPEAIQEQISQARSSLGPDTSGLVICFIHWGPNWSWEPGAALRHLGHCIIDSGADCVFGHSAHHVQGVEVYRGKGIVYSAGSLIDDYSVDERFCNDLGCLYTLHVDSSGELSLEGRPVHITHEWLPAGRQEATEGRAPAYLCEVNFAKGQDFQWAAKKIRDLSAKLGTQVEVDERVSTLSVQGLN